MNTNLDSVSNCHKTLNCQCNKHCFKSESDSCFSNEPHPREISQKRRCFKTTADDLFGTVRYLVVTVRQQHQLFLLIRSIKYHRMAVNIQFFLFFLCSLHTISKLGATILMVPLKFKTDIVFKCFRFYSFNKNLINVQKMYSAQQTPDIINNC